MDKPSGFDAIRSAFANRNFRLYTGGNIGSHIGTWIQRVALGWLTWELTRSAFWLGLVSMAELAPVLVLGPLAGAVADRVERIRAIKVTQTLCLLQAAILAILTWTGMITAEVILGLSLCLGVVQAFNQPLRFAVIPSLVPRNDMPAAISINSLSFNASRVIGPAIAGWVILESGTAMCFALNALSYLIFIVTLFMMGPEAVDAPTKRAPAGNIPREIMDGVRYAAGHRGIATMIVLILFVSVFGRAYSELLPGFAEEAFGRGADGLAMLTSALGAGAVVATTLLAARGTLDGLTRVVVRSLLVLAVSVAAFALAPDIYTGMACAAVGGFATVTCSVGMQTLLQSAIARDMRGRVMSLYGMIQRSGPSVGALLVGAVHDAFGLRWPVLAGAVLCLAAWLCLLPQRAHLARSLETAPDEAPVKASSGG